MLLTELFSVRGNESSTLLSLYGTLQVVMHFLISWHSDALYYTFTLQSSLFENVYLVYLRAYSGMEISKDEQDLFSQTEKNSVPIKTKLTQ